MNNQPDLILEALKEATIQLRNMETASRGSVFSVGYAQQYDDYLAIIVRLASEMHIKSREAIVKDATRILMTSGYEVVSPKRDRVTTDIDYAIATVVKAGYKVTDANGGNY